MKKKNIKGKLSLAKETIANLNRVTMEGIYGGTGEVCESIIYSCDPEKYHCPPETETLCAACT